MQTGHLNCAGMFRSAAVAVLAAFIQGCGGGGGVSSQGVAPVIAKQPRAATIESGTSAAFEVELASGVEGYAFQWLRNGAPVIGASAPRYSIPSVRCGDSASVFSVVISGGGGTVVSDAVPLWVSGCAMAMLAGTIGGAGALDGPVASARFMGPAAVASDSSGSFYVADTENHLIRKISTNGMVSTLAGLAGRSGSADGLGAAARFNRPGSLAVDSQGNVYVSDGGNSTIRKIDPIGMVSTIAGVALAPGFADGPSASARIGGGGGVAVDVQNNVYFADAANHVLRRLTPAGVVSTIAGSAGQRGWRDGVGAGAAFDSPYAIAVAPDGGLIVGDNGSSTIRRVTAAGVVSTIAGTAYERGSVDGLGVAARFNSVQGIAVNSAGDAYVTDLVDQTVRKLSTTGAVTTLAGVSRGLGFAGVDPIGIFRSSGAPTVDTSGNVYVPDTADSVIRKITPDGRVGIFAGSLLIRDGVDGVGGVARFDLPTGLATDAEGSVYVADLGNAAIRKIQSGARVTTYAGALRQVGSADGTPGAARFRSPVSLAFGADGTLYVAEDEGTDIRRIASTGEVTTLTGFPGSVVAVDAQGNVYAASAVERLIRVRNRRGDVSVLTGYGQPGFDEGDTAAAARFWPSGMAVDAAGNLYVSDVGNFTIRRISPDGRSTTIAGTAGEFGAIDGVGSSARFASPGAVAINAVGEIFVADRSFARSDIPGMMTASVISNTVRRILPDGAVVTVVGTLGSIGVQSGPLPGSLSAPMGLAFDRQGMLYVSSEAAILRVDLR